MPSKSQRIVLSTLFFSSFAQGFAYQVAVLLPLIIQEFQTSYAEAGLLTTMFGLSGILFSIIIGKLADRYGAEPVGTLATAISFIGVIIIALSPSFVLVLVGRFIAGTGSFGSITAVYILISKWSESSRLATVHGLSTAASSVAGVMSAFIYSWLGLAYGWRIPYYLGGHNAFSVANYFSPNS